MSEWGNKDFANNKPQFLANNIPGSSKVFLVNSGRLANASFGDGVGVSHQGWVNINQGTGWVDALAVSNVNPALSYANAWLDFTQTGASVTNANGYLLVTGTAANTVSVVLNSKGAGYNTAPVITANTDHPNNATLIFTVTPGGRMNRVSAETLVVISTPAVANANSGLPYFTGV